MPNCRAWSAVMRRPTCAEMALSCSRNSVWNWSGVIVALPTLARYEWPMLRNMSATPQIAKLEDEHGKQDLGHPAGGASSQGVERPGSRVQCLSGGGAAWN